MRLFIWSLNQMLTLRNSIISFLYQVIRKETNISVCLLIKVLQWSKHEELMEIISTEVIQMHHLK